MILGLGIVEVAKKTQNKYEKSTHSLRNIRAIKDPSQGSVDVPLSSPRIGRFSKKILIFRRINRTERSISPNLSFSKDKTIGTLNNLRKKSFAVRPVTDIKNSN